MKNNKLFAGATILMCLIIAIVIIATVIIRTDEKTDANIQAASETTEEQVRYGGWSDAIIYNGIKYCGLGMSWKLEELPEGFEEIGEFRGALTEANEELTSTMIFRDNEILYHYVDAEGLHYFCAKHKSANIYIGICGAKEYTGEEDIYMPHKLNDY